MSEVRETNLSIMLKPDYISWFEITELLHLAYAEHAIQGLEYSACSQSASQTCERVGDGLCIIAMLDGKLVGTATLHLREKVAHLCQFAVHPDYRNYGIGSRLEEYIFELALSYKKESLVCDTSEEANRIVRWYVKNGWQKIAMTSHSTTNFYSICFRKPVCGRKYSWMKSWLRFIVSSIYCKLRLKRNGEKRYFIKVFSRTYK